MQERHLNRQKYFDEQVITSRKYVMPLLGETIEMKPGMSVLEIGCGEGGNLKPFLDSGMECVGMDLSESKIGLAKEFYKGHAREGHIHLEAANIYEWHSALAVQYDFIIMRDVIEHIPDQEKFMGFVKQFLKPGGRFFLGFPPWHNPFGGHQQVCRSKLLSKMPWIHLLPNFMYRGLLKLFGEKAHTIQELMEVKSTGITLGRFERILRKEKYTTHKAIFWFTQPNYEVKFNLKPRQQWGFIARCPGIRNFFVTCGYYVVSKEN